MLRSILAMLALIMLAGALLPGSVRLAEARECLWSGEPPICVPSCPPGWKYMTKRPGGCETGFQMLCCEPQGSTTHIDGVAPCHKQCAPLLGAVQPKTEAQRVYRNCRTLCDHKGTSTCPDGTEKPWTDPKC